MDNWKTWICLKKTRWFLLLCTSTTTKVHHVQDNQLGCMSLEPSCFFDFTEDGFYKCVMLRIVRLKFEWFPDQTALNWSELTCWTPFLISSDLVETSKFELLITSWSDCYTRSGHCDLLLSSWTSRWWAKQTPAIDLYVVLM